MNLIEESRQRQQQLQQTKAEKQGTESTVPATEATQPKDSNNDAGTGSAEVGE